MKKENVKNRTVKTIMTEKTANSLSNKWILFGLLIVVLTTVAIYSKAIMFDFLASWDDNLYITFNSHIKGLEWSNIKLFFTQFYAGNYQPFVLLMYAIEYKLVGNSAILFHLDNLLFHLINTFLVFVFIRKIAPKNSLTALITASFFAVHPMHVESVAWISERKDVLYSFFFLLSLIEYVNYLQSNKRKHLVFVGLLFFCSCMCKSAAVILPMVLLLLDYYYNRKFALKVVFEKISFVIISFVFGIVAIQSQHSAIQHLPANISIFDRISLVSFSLISYVFKAIVPLKLSAIYPYPVEINSGLLPPQYFLSLVILCGLIYFVWSSRKRGKDIIFGFLFFIITIFLVLQFLPVGGATMADRYTYIPYIGLFFIIGKYVEYLSTKWNIKYIITSFLLGIIIFSFLTYERVQKWENDETLFTDVIDKYPKCDIAYNNLGCFYLNYYGKNIYSRDAKKREFYIKKSIENFDNAIKIKPSDVNSIFNRGCAISELKDKKASIEDFSKVIELDNNNASAYYNRGNTKKDLNDLVGALKDYNKAIELDPKFIPAYNNRSMIKCILKDYKGTIDDYNKMIELNPKDTITLKNKKVIQVLLNN